MITRSMFSRLILTLAMLMVCATLALAWRAPKLSKQPTDTVAWLSR
ncbi:MAG: hypothetical protein WAK01_15705 [Methylocystis sp.]